MRYRQLVGLAALLGSLLVGCAGTPGVARPSAAPEQDVLSKTLVVVGRAEPKILSSTAFRSLGLTPDLPTRIFNAHLTIRNDAGLPIPYLADAVPLLDTETWRVGADGTMETVYRLKPNTAWHSRRRFRPEHGFFAPERTITPLATRSIPTQPNAYAGGNNPSKKCSWAS